MPPAAAPPRDPGTRLPPLEFGPFRLLPDRRLLLRDGAAVDLGGRAFDLLLALLRREGGLARKQDLLAEVWPESRMEEGNLRVHLSQLRRALRDGQGGQRYIVTIPGQGYRFVCPLQPLADPAAPPPPVGLPRPLGRLVGRAEFAATVLRHCIQARCVTLVGPGGIGKTSLATHVAEQLLPACPDGVAFVDLASVPRDDLVAPAVAFALGVASFSADPSPAILAALRTGQRLLVLDCCERVAAGAAALVETLLRGAPGLRLLATSREPLHAEGEWVLRVPPLGLPPAEAGLTAAQALAYPAVQLLVDRVGAVLDGFVLTDAEVPAVVAICARLDGIALAIELAAAQAAAFDLPTLAGLLQARFRLQARGRRTAAPRHRTMQAVLDWSHAALPPAERAVFRRLAVFDGAMTLAAAEDVAGGGGEDVTLAIASLVDKSLLTSQPGPRFRLLDLTRAYAAERLAESGERDAVARRHALHCLGTFRAAEAEWPARTVAGWLAEYGPELGNLRAALDWAFSPAGDASLGIELAAVAVPLLFELSLAEECRRRAAQALRALAAAGDGDGHTGMRLRATLGAAMTYTPGPVPETVETWQAVLALATRLEDASLRGRAVWGLWTAHCYGGRPRQALAQAEAFTRLSVERGDDARQLMGERLCGVSLHYLGEQEEARARLESMLARYAPGRHRWQTLGFSVDHRLMAQATLARIHWLQGRPAEALRLAEATLAAVQAQDHAISLCYVLAEASLPLALLAGDHDAAAAALRQLQDAATRNGLAIWQAAAGCTWQVLQLAEAPGLDLLPLREGFAALDAAGYGIHAAWLQGLAAAALVRRGAAAEAAALLAAA
ncbi:ATP-binding protein, partial [Paracraurococcus ruber]